MPKELDIGDPVVLKGDGPPMVVLSVDKTLNRVRCGWFTDRGEYRTEHFPEQVIRPISAREIEARKN